MDNVQNRPFTWLRCAALILFAAGPALVAAGPTAAQTPPPPVQGATAQSAQADQNSCVPSCRSGYFCSEGQCKSLCNPPCEAGLMCTQAGQCAYPAQPPPGTQAAPAPMVIYQQGPMLSWRQERRALRQQQRAERREQRRQAKAALPYRGRFYAGGHFTLFGNGRADLPYVYNSTALNNERTEPYAVGSQLGFEAGFEFRLGSLFGLGPAVRFSQSDFASADLLDITINPTFHVPFGIAELVIPVNFGFTLAWDDGPNDYSSSDVDGIGLVLGVSPGLILWPTDFFGIYANVGLSGHLVSLNDDGNRFYTVSLNSGVTFGY